MNKSLLRNIIIAITAVAFLSVLYSWVVRWDPKTAPPSEPQTQQPVIISLSRESIKNLRITNPEGSYTIVKINDAFTLDGLETARLDAGIINSAVTKLSSLKAERIIAENPDNTADYGLSQPVASLTAHTVEGSVFSLFIGDKAPTNDGYYVMYKNTVYLVSDYYLDSYLKGIDVYRDKKITSIDFESLDSLSITSQTDKIVEIRQKNDADTPTNTINENMIMTYPYYEYVSNEKLFKLTEGLTEITASDIIEDNASNVSEYGIGKYTVTVNDKSGAHVFRLGNKDNKGNIYAMYDGINILFTLDGSILDRVQKVTPNDLLCKFIQMFYIDDISSVSYTLNETSHTLGINRNDTENILYTINGKSVAEDLFKQSYQKILGISFTSVADKSQHGSKVGSVTFTFNDGHTDTAEYFEYDERNYIAEHNGSSYLLLRKSFDSVLSELEG